MQKIKIASTWLVLFLVVTAHIELCTLSVQKYLTPSVFIGLSFVVLAVELLEGVETIKINRFILFIGVNLVTSMYSIVLIDGVQINSFLLAFVALLPSMLAVDDSMLSLGDGIKYWKKHFSKKECQENEPIEHLIED